MGWRRQRLFFGITLFLGVSSQYPAGLQEQPSLPSGKPSIQIFLTASDRQGAPVTPAQSDLVVFVDKQAAQVETLRSAKNDTLMFALLVDVSRSDASSEALIRKSALQIFQSLSTKGGQGYLVLFNASVAISKGPAQVAQVQDILDHASFGGGTAVYDAIQQTCIQKLSRAANAHSPRRAIILISDGEDNLSHVPHDIVEETAEKEGVAVFTLATRSSLAGPQGEHFLTEVSRDTGGQAVRGKDLAEGVAPLLAAIEGQSVLSFAPTQPLDTKPHSLVIKSSQKDVHVSAPAHLFVQ